MKSLLLLGAALAALTVVAAETPTVPAPTPVAASDPAPSAADQAYNAMMEIFRNRSGLEGLTRKDRAYWQQQDRQMRAFAAAARDFAANYPQDPRRYDGVIQSSYTRPWFILDFKPEFDAAPSERNLIVDEPALEAFFQQQRQYLSEVVALPEATTRQRGGAFFALLADARGAARLRGQPFDVTVFRPVVDRVLAAMPDQRALPVIEQYVGALRAQAPAQADALLASLKAQPKLAAALQEAEARQAAEQAKAADAAKRRAAEIGQMKFTAADGREVDLTKLRGKVVLIDFWATWCGPCVAEIPNVVANYRKYHDRGFEVVGVTLENAGLTGREDAAAKETKLAAAKKKMTDFTAKQGMPWPQHFDGRYWKNEFAVAYGIQSIPAMFLLDQEGRIVSSEARGPKLEAEIKRLLKLE